MPNICYSCYTGTLNIYHVFICSVFFEVPPRFLEEPVNITDTVGEVVQLICKAFGVPAPTIEWFKDGNNTFSNDHVIITTFPGISVTSSILLFVGLNVHSAGEYYCNATNDLVRNISIMSSLVTVTANCELVFIILFPTYM